MNAGPVAIREMGSCWERLLGLEYETWILRREFTGELLAIASRMGANSMTWCTKVRLPDGRVAEGIVIEDSKIPSVFGEAEAMLANAGVCFQPVAVGNA
jgi:hypothetical protein